ncbi:MAG: hypothetical protein ACRCTR_08540 [Actinomycetota bacterium]
MPIGEYVELPNLAVGTYNVQVEITPAWRSALKLSTKDVTAKFPLKVIRATDQDAPVPEGEALSRISTPGKASKSGLELPDSLARAREAGHVDGFAPTKEGPFAAGGVRSAPGVTPDALT